MNADPIFYESDWRAIDSQHDFHTFDHGLRVKPRSIVVRVRNNFEEGVLEITDAVVAFDDHRVTISGARTNAYKFVQVWCSTKYNAFVSPFEGRVKQELLRTPWLDEVEAL